MKAGNFWQRFAIYISPRDNRYEELKKGNITRNVIDDLTAGFIVAAVAIPLSMGFAMASGLRPGQGIIGGIIAGLIGAVFGGSKYQVYGPTAAFIPVIAGLMATYGHGFLVLASFIAGILLLFSGFLKLGGLVFKIPHSIVVGFTVGIAIIIGLSQAGPALGIKEKAGHTVIAQFLFLYDNIDKINIAAIMMTGLTILFCKAFERLSGSIPGPVPALLFGYFGAQTFWSDKGLVMIGDQYGNISTDLFAFTPPLLPVAWNATIVFDLVYYALAFFVIAAIESLSCGRAADKLAYNTGTAFDPDAELRGKSMINIFGSLFNGFPNTGALGRTALNIRVKGRSPLSGIAQCIFKLILIIAFARYLEKIPMACITGILLYVARGMVKTREIRGIVRLNNYHVGLMFYTIAAVSLLGIVTGILSALVIYAVCYRMFEKKKKRSYANKTRWTPEQYGKGG